MVSVGSLNQSFLLVNVTLFVRLYPVIPANARVITERDIQVGGYLIPKDVSIILKHQKDLWRSEHI